MTDSRVERFLAGGRHNAYLARYADSPRLGRRVAAGKLFALLAAMAFGYVILFFYSLPWWGFALWTLVALMPMGFLAGIELGRWLYWTGVLRGALPNLGKMMRDE